MVTGHLSSPAHSADCACTVRLAPYSICLCGIQDCLGIDYIAQCAQPGAALHACFANFAGSIPRRVWVCMFCSCRLPSTPIAACTVTLWVKCPICAVQYILALHVCCRSDLETPFPVLPADGFG